MTQATSEISRSCHHCGDDCPTESHRIAEYYFCCQGCQTVYELLSESGLEAFYAEGDAPGVRARGATADTYAYLDEERIQQLLLLYADRHQHKVRLQLPTIHCSSCLYLLEHLGRLHAGVIAVRVDFAQRQALITYDPEQLGLRALAELLHRIGYPPQIDLTAGQEARPSNSDRPLLLKIGITGFLFGNIMLLSFPEYLSTGSDLIEGFRGFFSYLILALSLPVLLYGARDYFRSSWAAIQQGGLTIDVPIAIGISVIFLRSLYEIIAGQGAGYLDSMAGLVFFLLIGRWYQGKVYDSLSFERDFRSFFPLSVRCERAGEERSIPVMDLAVGNAIAVLGQDIIPADCVLESEAMSVDYSFVTGESRAVELHRGDRIYAGGRNLSGRVALRVEKKVSQSYLTDLWNQSAFDRSRPVLSGLLDRLSGRFTRWVLAIAALTGLYWGLSDMALLMDAVTAVLIVACPCALALSVPYALGNARRLLAKAGLYTKSTETLEALAAVDTIVFDKTGTLTHQGTGSGHFVGEPVGAEVEEAVAALVAQSSHPISRMIAGLLGPSSCAISGYTEVVGQGIAGQVSGMDIKLGSADYVGANAGQAGGPGSYLWVDGRVLGRYEADRALRPAVEDIVRSLRPEAQLLLLSGDNDAEAGMLSPYFQAEEMHFMQSPQDKMAFIQALQEEGKRVMMIGDGLNDAGALQQADVGVALTDDLGQFTPASDAILQSDALQALPAMRRYAAFGLRVVHWSVAFSLLYNLVGIGYAVQGLLTPLIAAILMPLSSVTVVGFAVLMTSARAPQALGSGRSNGAGA